ncbi:hypothetical protein QN277_022425 [Acacia crassicarpa]|uniref:isoflavone 7-O-methyltransferase n=1 Tax=Acacia crassicarpa TaxID=499986 RepID=A0AAE1K9T6_9FABA|nr:hypothetical protein QN277_022425 [Acacia crassicarpa]
MESQNEGHEAATRRMLEAQTHGWNHVFSFINSMSLRSAIELNIPDIIHKHGKPMPIHLLASSLQIQPSKTPHLRRLMRFLTHTGFFSLQKPLETSDDPEGYILTNASTLFLKDHPFTLAPFIFLMLDPILVKPWEHLPAWFQNNDPTPFETASGKAFYDYAWIRNGPRTFNNFIDTLASDSKLVGKVLVEQCRDVFKGCGSLVDVGGNTGTMAKALAEAFPEMECTVFDLPSVVGGLKDCENLKFVQGDMFQTIPPAADIIMSKWTLCDWDDERCLKLLKNFKEAVTSKGKRGKLVLINEVVEDGKADYDDESVETQLQFDLALMMWFPGKERNEKEWAHLFSSAGFTTYKITPVLGIRSLIEVFP